MHLHLVVRSDCGFFQVATPHTTSIVGTNCNCLIWLATSMNHEIVASSSFKLEVEMQNF